MAREFRIAGLGIHSPLLADRREKAPARSGRDVHAMFGGTRIWHQTEQLSSNVRVRRACPH